jgi:MFS family permease
VLANRQFLWFLVSWTSAGVGYSVYAISVVWLAYTISHSFLVVGAVLFIEYATYTGVFLAGPIADRVGNQRTLYVACYPVMGLAAVAIGVGELDGFLTVPLLLALIAIISILWDIAWAAGNAAPGLLVTRDEQFAAQGVLGAVGGANAIAGYAAGGALILLVGAEGGMILYGILLGAAAVLALPLTIRPSPTPGETFGESFRAGWRLITDPPGRPLLKLASVDAIQGFFGAVPALLITLLATSSFHASATAFGVLFVSYVVGGTLAGIVFGQWNPRSKIGRIIVVALLGISGTFAFVIGLPTILVLEAIGFFAMGFAWNAYLDAKYAFLRGSFEPSQLGRVVSNMYLLPGIASSAGALVLGSLANGVSPLVLGGIAAIGFLGAGLLAFVLPGISRLRF